MTFIPKSGKKSEEILTQLKSFKEGDANWKDGKTWSLVYYLGKEHHDLLADSYKLYMNENGLNQMAFKSLKRMEHEVVRSTVELFHGEKDSVGCLTSGGTESILMAIKTYRDKARSERPWLKTFEVIAPETVHVAFNKACEYFDVKLKLAKVDKDFKVDIKHVKKLITNKTILLVGSAPQYPHGIIDPIEELSELALKKKINLHVDACVGGFLLPWMEQNGVDLPLWDFRLKGVTSISADLHKYGFASKGASTLTYRSMEIMKHQFFVCENFPGGVYASVSLPGTKPGGSYATAWAAMQFIGVDGYKKYAKIIMYTTNKLIKGISSIEGLQILGNPQMSLIAYNSTNPNLSIYAVADEMVKRGWLIDRQQKPECLHAMVTPNHEKIADVYLKDLRESVDYVLKNPKLAASGEAAMYGMMAKIPFRGMIKKSVIKILEQMYGPEGKVPDLTNQGETPKNMDEFLTKVAGQALEVKRQFDVVKDNMKNNLGKKLKLRK